jgi:hypothetical protein
MADLHSSLPSALELTQRWEAEQARSGKVLSAMLDFHGRLQLLNGDANPATLGVLAEHPQAVERLRAKHVHGLENLAAALHEGIGRLQAVHAELEALHAAVWKRHALAAQPTESSLPPALHEAAWDVVGAGRGIEVQRVRMLPPLQSVEWLAELESLYGAELLDKLLLAAAVDFGAEPRRLQEQAARWAQKPQGDGPGVVQRLSLLVDSLTLDAPGSRGLQ